MKSKKLVYNIESYLSYYLNKLDLTFLLLFIPLLTLEVIFYSIAFGICNFFCFIRIFCFITLLSYLLSILINLINIKTIKTIIIFLIVIFFSAYGFVELEFKHFLETYYSFISVAEGGMGRIDVYILYFISDAKWYYYLCFLPVLVLIFLIKKLKNKELNNIKLKFTKILISLLVLIIFFSVGSKVDIKENYLTHNNLEITLRNYGLVHGFVRDIVAIKYRKADKIVIEEKEAEDDDTQSIIKYDDTIWNNIKENETNSALKQIDEYLMSQEIVKDNEMTSIFKHKNIIYILCESLDYLAIDKDLTPTLYKMFKEGYSFENHYTPIYCCGTGDSDFAGLTGLFPVGSTCTFYGLKDNVYPQALPNLFKNEGYDTYAFHNWNDEFYDRNIVYPNMGIDEYYDIDDLDFKLVLGWQSDKTLVEKAYDIFSKSDKYFAYIITSTMHWPYDLDSYYGNLDVDKILSVHEDYPIEVCRYISKAMEFDRAMAYLLERLEADNKLDDTVIIFYPDHNPFKMGDDLIKEYGNAYMDRTSGFNKDLTPFVIYNSNTKANSFNQLCSTFDQPLIIANMFDLKYDSRLYVGKDIFSSDTDVIFLDGDFINKYGSYIYNSDSFTPNNPELSERKIKEIKTSVANKIAVSKNILKNNYFAYRKEIVIPK